MITKPLISVIVPVYKVEQYLNRCVDSILNQTFKDFELILVDDGSPDNCPAICDDYASKYDFVHVIHKENGGLSDARNTGIDWAFINSESEYLLFVDSDDIIKKNLLKKVIKHSKKHNADIVCFGIEMTDENFNILEWGTMKIKKNVFFDKQDRFAPIVPPCSIGDYAVNKLWKKELFKNIRYPVGKTFEDVYTTYKLFDKANSISLYKKNLYVYRRRQGSITKTNGFDENFLNYYYSTKEKFKFITDMCPDYAEKAIICVINAVSIKYNQICDNAEFYKTMLDFKSFIVENQDLILNNNYINDNQLEICKKILSI